MFYKIERKGNIVTIEVQIDVKNKPNSCEYNAVMEHENMHIKTYLGVVDDFKVDLQRSVFNAADSIMPVWVQSFDDIINTTYNPIDMYTSEVNKFLNELVSSAILNTSFILIYLLLAHLLLLIFQFLEADFLLFLLYIF